MNELIERLRRLKRMRGGIGIIVLAALLIEFTAAIEYLYVKETVKSQMLANAETQLRAVRGRTAHQLSNVELAVNCMAWAVEDNLESRDSIEEILKQLMVYSPIIINCAVAMEPDYYADRGRWYELLVTKDSDGRLVADDRAGSADHDYLSLPWYRNALASDSGYWSEPYRNTVGQHVTVSSYSRQLLDNHGRQVGVICADISLGWLDTYANSLKPADNSYVMMLSREGTLMVYPPDTSKVLKVRVADIHDNRHSSVDSMNRAMMNGESGMCNVKSTTGEHRTVFYGPVNSKTGWSLAVIYYTDEVFANLRRMQWYVFALMLAGVGLMSVILYRTARNLSQLYKTEKAKNRIESELHIAQTIQQGMLPRTYPPYPDRRDIDVFGILEPAREVGGDLFDFFIRDEKLYFCIGDVAGKGVPASLVMSVTRSLFRSISLHHSNPTQVVEMMNDTLINMNNQSIFVTFFMGVLDLPTGRLRYCNAGHEIPIVLGDTVNQPEMTPNLPLGAWENYHYQGGEDVLEPGRALLLYTDGLTEARNPQGKMFGHERVKRVMGEIIGQGITSPQQIVDYTGKAVRRFVSQAEQSDDLTLLAVHYTPQAPALTLERRLELTNSLNEVPAVNTFTDEVTQALSLPAATGLSLRLAIEEAVVNVINYAYPPGRQGAITLDAKADDNELRFVITDRGTPFDPTAREKADTTLGVEDRPIGGLGITLVRQYVDAMNYEHHGGCNILTLIKHLEN